MQREALGLSAHLGDGIFSLLLDPIEGPQSLPPRSGPSVYSTAVGEIPASARTGLGAHWDALGSKTDSQPS